MRRPRPLPLLCAALLAAPLLAGCSSENAKGCPDVAREVAGQVTALRTAVAKSSADSDPRDAATALREMQQDLDDIATQSGTNGTAATKAIGDLSLAVSNAKNALDKHETPDIQPVVTAAGELTTACPKNG
jgi:hypothetical protein